MANSMKIVEVSHVAPLQDSSSNSLIEFTFQLTFLDTFYLKFHLGEFLVFYSFINSNPSSFASVLSTLKHSLSFILLNFLPLAGNLIRPPYSQKPFLLYKPGDAISLTLAESDTDFNHVSSKHVQQAIDTAQLDHIRCRGFRYGIANHSKGNSRECKRKIYLVLNADYKAHLDPPVLENHFSNYGVAIVAEKIGEVIKGLENEVLEGAKERLSKWGSLEASAQVIGVSRSHQFGLYSLDFGWGKPKKM
ncbi:anthocyanin 5-aromatic acyltransferase-like [Ziziphus jujuba]|uniref:Anthocyanin 5-aromatic acyltransferase-like n=1 Tax=Ziziphus jujuba TaxID=326968 RepID=A0ABM4ADU5_ZIZJJ|nr:anthocyanin 5-aromatic acyltransferase-like [Ziziphus jujuba]